MPGGSGKARRSCPLCKPYKFAGNSGGYDGRRKASEVARAPGSTRSQRRAEAKRNFYEY